MPCTGSHRHLDLRPGAGAWLRPLPDATRTPPVRPVAPTTRKRAPPHPAVPRRGHRPPSPRASRKNTRPMCHAPAPTDTSTPAHMSMGTYSRHRLVIDMTVEARDARCLACVAACRGDMGYGCMDMWGRCVPGVVPCAVLRPDARLKRIRVCAARPPGMGPDLRRRHLHLHSSRPPPLKLKCVSLYVSPKINILLGEGGTSF
eukprot:scaffold3555_cov113-Isochrysis_galbana.AAC.3